MTPGIDASGPARNAAGEPLHVVLLNWNGWRDTIECLDSVFATGYPGLRVVVCDNASSDGSLDQIRAWADGRLDAPDTGVVAGTAGHMPARGAHRPIPYLLLDREEAEAGASGERHDPPLTLIATGANLGFAGGNNVGLRYLLAREACGFVWILNNDVIVAPDTPRLLVGAIERDPGVGAAGGVLLEYHHPDRVETVGGGKVRRWAGFPTTAASEWRAAYGTAAAEVDRIDFITGACLMTRAKTLRDVGLIDERYFLYCEDTDWSFRMVEAGLRLACEPAALVWHKGGGSVGHRTPLHDYYIVKSSLLLVHRFNRWLLPAAMAYSLWRALLPKVWRAEWRRAVAVLQAYRDFGRQVRTGVEQAVLFAPSTPAP